MRSELERTSYRNGYGCQESVSEVVTLLDITATCCLTPLSEALARKKWQPVRPSRSAELVGPMHFSLRAAIVVLSAIRHERAGPRATQARRQPAKGRPS